MAKVTVNAGICGFTATITAVANEDDMVDVKMVTGCPNFKDIMASDLEFDPLTCCFGKIGEGEIFEMFRGVCPHPSCPFPTAMVKAVEVAGGLALPKDVTMTIEK